MWTLKTGFLCPCPLGWSTQTKNRLLGSDFIFLCELFPLVLLKQFGNFPLAFLNHRPAFILREDSINLVRASTALSPYNNVTLTEESRQKPLPTVLDTTRAFAAPKRGANVS